MELRNKTLVCGATLLLASSAGLAGIDLAAPVNYATPQRPAGVAAADFTGDGAVDLAVITDTPNKLSLLTNGGGGVFSGPVNFAISNGSGAGHAVAADFDGDKDMDVAVALQNSAGVRVMLNAGGAFTNGSTTTVGDSPRWIEAGDFDGDKDTDMAVVNRGSNDVSILLNAGDGTFVTTTVAVGDDPRAAAVGDFDGDKDTDLAVTNHGDRTITILLNDGHGAFTAGATLQASGERPEGIVAADLNGNGTIDLAADIDLGNAGRALVYLNTGGVFSGPTGYAVAGQNPGAMAAVDLDVDGDVDLVTANQDTGNTSVLPNAGNATFGAATVVATGTSPERIATGDFDHNGGVDLAVTNRDSNTTSVLLNNAGGVVCDADLDGNGVLDLFDFLAFTNLFNAGDPAADCVADGTFDLFDFLCYVNLFNAGC